MIENQIHPEADATSSYIIPTLGLSDGWFIFAYVSNFLSFITPQDLPVGTCYLWNILCKVLNEKWGHF